MALGGYVAAVDVARVRVLHRPLLLGVVGVTLLGAILRLSSLGSQSIWLDEATTASYLHESFGGMVAAVWSKEATPPLYFIVVWLWSHVFGPTAVGLRSLSALFGIATIPVTFLAGRELFSRRAGLVAAALVAANPLYFHYSQEARAYAMLDFLCALALLGFARVLRTQARRDWLLWFVASVLAVATHYFAGFFVAPLAVWLLIRCRNWMSFAWVAALGVVCVAAIPAAAHQRPSGGTNFIPAIALWSRVQGIAQSPLVGDQGSPVSRKVWVSALVALAAVTIYGLRSGGPYRRNAIMLASIGLATLALPLIVAAAGTDEVIARYVQTAWIPLLLVLAASLTSRSGQAARFLMIGTTVALCATGTALAVTEAGDPGRQRDDWRAYVPLVIDGAVQPAATVLSPALDAAAYLYYAPHSTTLPRSGALVRELDVVYVYPHGAEPPLLKVIAPNAFLVGNPPLARIVAPPGFVVRATQTDDRLTLVRLIARSPRRITPRTLRALTFSKSGPIVLLDQHG